MTKEEHRQRLTRRLENMAMPLGELLLDELSQLWACSDRREEELRKIRTALFGEDTK